MCVAGGRKRLDKKLVIPQLEVRVGFSRFGYGVQALLSRVRAFSYLRASVAVELLGARGHAPWCACAGVRAGVDGIATFACVGEHVVCACMCDCLGELGMMVSAHVCAPVSVRVKVGGSWCGWMVVYTYEWMTDSTLEIIICVHRCTWLNRARTFARIITAVRVGMCVGVRELLNGSRDNTRPYPRAGAHTRLLPIAHARIHMS